MFSKYKQVFIKIEKSKYFNFLRSFNNNLFKHCTLTWLGVVIIESNIDRCIRTIENVKK